MAKETTIGLNLDISAFRKSLSSAIAGAKSLAGIKPKIAIDVDDSEVDDAGKKIGGLNQTVKVDIDTKGADQSISSFGGKVSKLGAIAGGALGGAAAQGVTVIGQKLFEGSQAADEFGDKLEVAFTQQGIADVDAEIEKVRKSTLNLANDLGLPVERTRELAGTVATLGGFTGKSAEDLTKLSAGLEVFTDAAVKGEAVAKAFSRGVADPEGAAAIDALSKKYPQLAETLRSNLSPSEKLAKANEVLGESFKTVADQQSDVGGILNKLQNQLGDVFEDIGSQLLEAVIPIAQSLLPVISSLLPVLQGILTPLTPILEKIGGLVVELVKQLTGPLLNIVDSVLTPLLGVFNSLIEPIKLLISTAFAPLASIINAFAGIAKALIPILANALIPVIPVITQVFLRLLPVVANIVVILTNLIAKIVSSRAIMLLLNVAVGLLMGAINLLLPVIEFFVKALELVVNIAAKVITYISNLVSAIASFNLENIKNALLGLEEVQQSQTKTADKATKAIEAQAAAQDELNKTNNQASAAKTIDPEAAKKAAEEIAKLRAELAQLNTEQAKARELAAADLIGDEAERARKRLEIETKYNVAALEQERKSLKSRGGVRQAEEAVINKKLELLREDAANKLREINGKAEAERAKAAEEAEKKVTEISTKLTEDRLAKLKEVFAAGGVGVASEIVKIQRSLIEAQLSSAVDAIVESTPAFKAGAAAISNQLLAGLINADEARKRTAELRQKITGELLALPADSADVYAVQIRNAYDKAAEDIGKGTQEITDAVQKAVKAGDVDGYVESLKGLGTVLGNADYATPFKEASEATRGLNDEQEKLIQLVKDGETTYQDAAARFAEIDAERQRQASATAEVFATAFQAVAQSQLEAAQKTIESLGELRARQQQIADEIVAVEARKNAALEELRAQNLANLAQYEAAAKVITDKADADTKALQAEQTANTAKQADAQSQALAQIGTAAGAAFAGLATGAVSAGDALKAVVGDTVKSLLLLYTPSIVALFSSIIPPPFGQIAGFAAVAALQALLASALSGFSEGGYTGNGGTSDIAGVVHGKEFVVNAKGTAQNRALLEHINKGGSLDTFASAAPVTEFQMMRAELSAIRQRLDSMPNGINGRQAVAVDVGFDTYLYERDRRRAAVRSLRG